MVLQRIGKPQANMNKYHQIQTIVILLQSSELLQALLNIACKNGVSTKIATIFNGFHNLKNGGAGEAAVGSE